MDTKKPTRRSALNAMLGIGGLAAAGSVLYPVVSFLKPPEQTESSHHSVTLEKKFSEFVPGEWLIFRFGNKPGLLICDERGGEKRLLAYSATCTHLNCIVEYLLDERKIFCPCHNGSFDINGNNIAGPPPRPLEAFIVQITEDTVKIVKGA